MKVVETDSLYPINKFGADRDSWKPILLKIQQLNMKVRGVAFHVGSGGSSFESYK